MSNINKDNINKYDVSNYDYRKRIIELNKKEKELNSIVFSRSWKLTKPLRVCAQKVRTIKKNLLNKIDKVDLKYNSLYEDNIDFSNLKTDIKALAFYLPQFHTFKENDEWWGKGFTEWTNTKKATAKFPEHYQPREPHDDIGYYKLDNVETIKKQVALAKQHGIYGFCFYYYWFSGKRLMEKPVDIFLENTKIDFPFCFCWANENWTRTWDGLNNDVLIDQKYTKDDYENFMVDIKKYFDDKRYIRIDGKPLIMIYNPDGIPNFSELVNEWRKAARKIGIGEIVIWSKNSIFDDKFENAEFVDAEFDFAPNNYSIMDIGIKNLPTKNAYNYSKMVNDLSNIYENHFPLKSFYYSCTMGWDNSSRRKENYTVFCNYSPQKFYTWLKYIIKQTRIRNDENNRFIFINAWNEWAEGTYLEPDKKYGYTNINTLSKAIFDIPFDKSVRIINDSTEKLEFINKKIAIQIHLFHLDLIDELINNLNMMPYKYDLYISTNSEDKKTSIVEKLNNKLVNVNDFVVEVFNNRGRDVAPFIFQLNKDERINKYDYICHIHTKKSTHSDFGNNWRKYLYFYLFGSKNNIKSIFYMFEKENIGVIYPQTYSEIENTMSIGSNKKNFVKLLAKLKIDTKLDFDNLEFPSGTMFWAKTDAVKNLFEVGLKEKDFAAEKGQLHGTLAHAIERSICTIAKSNKYTCIKTINKTEN